MTTIGAITQTKPKQAWAFSTSVTPFSAVMGALSNRSAMVAHMALFNVPDAPAVRWDRIEVGMGVTMLAMGFVPTICRSTHLSQPVA